jgi:hypothetical protein
MPRKIKKKALAEIVKAEQKIQDIYKNVMPKHKEKG